MKVKSNKKDRRQIQISQLKSPVCVMASVGHGLMNTLPLYRKWIGIQLYYNSRNKIYEIK